NALTPGQASTTTSCPSGTASALAWNLPAFNSGTAVVKFCYADYTAQTSFNIPGIVEGSGTYRLLKAVVLPNLTMWQFTYNSYLDLTSVTFPTGGYINYSWINGSGGLNRTLSQRVLNANDGTGSHTWNYQYGVTVNGVPYLNVVTDPAGNDTVNTPCLNNGYICQSQYYSGSSSTGTLLKTTATQFHNDYNPY